MQAKSPKRPFGPVDNPHSPMPSPGEAGGPAATLSGAFRAALGKSAQDHHIAGADKSSAWNARDLKAGQDKAPKGGKAPPSRLAPRQGHK